MQTWMAVFIVVAALAIVLQTFLLIAFYIHFIRVSTALTQVAVTVESRLSPVLNRLERLMEDSHRQMNDIVTDTADIVRTIKTNGQRFDRVLEEATDRLRLQIIQADRMITGAMESIEEAGGELRKSIIEPVRTATAFVKGVRAGVEFFRGRRHMPDRRRETQDEGLFI
jgi:hypothetical protein